LDVAKEIASRALVEVKTMLRDAPVGVEIMICNRAGNVLASTSSEAG
jgi:hypothetical protein